MVSGNGIDAEPSSDCAAAASNLEPNDAATSPDGIVDGTSPNHAASPLNAEPSEDGIKAAIALVNLPSVRHAELNGAACEDWKLSLADQILSLPFF
jgi:hypothetical protein